MAVEREVKMELFHGTIRAFAERIKTDGINVAINKGVELAFGMGFIEDVQCTVYPHRELVDELPIFRTQLFLTLRCEYHFGSHLYFAFFCLLFYKVLIDIGKKNSKEYNFPSFDKHKLIS